MPTTIPHRSGRPLYSTDTAPDDAQPMVTALLRATMAGRDRATLDRWRAEAVAEIEDEDTLEQDGEQLQRRIAAIERELAQPSPAPSSPAPASPAPASPAPTSPTPTSPAPTSPAPASPAPASPAPASPAPASPAPTSTRRT
jgi:hypothetical protein